MRSPASRTARRSVERALRVVAFAALAGWIFNATRSQTTGAVAASARELARRLPSWTRGESVDSVRVRLDTALDAAHASWLAALRGAGVHVAWDASAIPGMAIETYPATDPAGGVFVLASAPGSRATLLSDALGPIDTLVPASRAAMAAGTPRGVDAGRESRGAPLGGARGTQGAPPAAPEVLTIARVAGVEGDLTLRSGSQPARAGVSDAAAPRRVFVAGAAGWEAKFVIAGLEEGGWNVNARLRVSPGHDVRQGGDRLAAFDTGRYAAVVLLDSASAEDAAGIERFVREGGGVVLAGDASNARRVRDVVAWRAGQRELAPLGTLAGDTAWRGLSRRVLNPIRGGLAIVLERRGGHPVLTARRHYAGRVVGVGYEQTWRWRMAGGDTGRVEHREWWSRVVAGVAARGVERDSIRIASSAAPLAALYDVLGPPSVSVQAIPARFPPRALSTVLGAILLAALLAEWLLRRARGAR